MFIFGGTFFLSEIHQKWDLFTIKTRLSHLSNFFSVYQIHSYFLGRVQSALYCYLLRRCVPKCEAIVSVTSISFAFLVRRDFDDHGEMYPTPPRRYICGIVARRLREILLGPGGRGLFAMSACHEAMLLLPAAGSRVSL